jgi:hypothetical protein
MSERVAQILVAGSAMSWAFVAGRLVRRRPGGGRECVELVGLVLQEAREDLFEGALPVAEPEAVLRWDRVQLAVGQLSEPAQGVGR